METLRKKKYFEPQVEISTPIFDVLTESDESDGLGIEWPEDWSDEGGDV